MHQEGQIRPTGRVFETPEFQAQVYLCGPGFDFAKFRNFFI
jgi:hypothetical protein